MHELSIAENLIGVIKEVSTREKFTKVNAITLKIGEMAGVDKDALSFCFEIAAKGTSAEGAHLNFEIIPLKAQCRSCNAEFKVEDFVFRCIQCGSPDIELISGREIRISYIDVKDGET